MRTKGGNGLNFVYLNHFMFEHVSVGLLNEETGDEVISRSGFTDSKKEERNIQTISYQLLYGTVNEISEVAKVLTGSGILLPLRRPNSKW